MNPGVCWKIHFSLKGGSRSFPKKFEFVSLCSFPTKNIIEDLTRSVQISQEMVRSSYQIHLIRTQVKNLTCSYQISLVRISKIRSDQDSEQINSDLSGNIIQKNRLSKITLYRSYQDSEQIYQVTFIQKKADYPRSLFIDLTKILNRSIW